MGVRAQVWIAPGTGLANGFLEQLEKLSQDSTAIMMAIFAVFALVHSGLAYLRPTGIVPTLFVSVHKHGSAIAISLSQSLGARPRT